MNNVIKNSNIANLSIGSIIESLADSYSALINNKIPLNKMSSVMLWGAPGVGKSQGVNQLAKLIESKTKKTVLVHDVRLLLFNPIDLRGIPTANKDKTEAIWLRPKIFSLDPTENFIHIIFLDEISAASPSVQAAAYQIVLDHKVGEHKLPDNVIVIAAGNRVTDKSVAYQMPKALANRFLHFNVKSDYSSWSKWATQNNIHPSVISFLNYHSEYLMVFDSDNSDELAFATPRSWEAVSNLLNYVNSNHRKIKYLIEGLIGKGICHEFISFLSIGNKIPDIEEIFAGKCKVKLTDLDVIYSTINAMTSYVKEKYTSIEQMNNSLLYALSFPTDYLYVLFKNYYDMSKEVREKLLACDCINILTRKLGTKINGLC